MKIQISDFGKSTLFILYTIGFIFSFTLSIPAYVNSSFLESLTSEQAIGIFYTISSTFSLATLLFLPRLLKKYGNYKVILTFSILFFVNFLGLVSFDNRFLLLSCFLLMGSMSTAILFCLDIFIEHNSLNVTTGSIRSIYLTCVNLAWLFSPWFAGTLVVESSYRAVYFVVALIMMPVIFIISASLSNFEDPEYKTFNIFETVKSIDANHNIKNIIVSNFLLQLFYSWMVVYTPIYLNQYIGFSWGDIGIIFSIMLLPFVFIQIPVGLLADKILGEKEILTLGFITMAIFTAVIPLIQNNNLFLWAGVLFMTRVGAAMVEVMNDTYFFKKVSDKNLNIIKFYRAVNPIAYIVGPMLATIFMIFLPMANIYYILGLLMIFGLRYSLTIKDTK